ncbi:EscV/YscV/HrcV family type III secretion system export apparatus protein [Citrobacter sp. Cu233]|uniref:EscV/YscV/HrcV family type III secretion system export apparatus protein n=1 Tax=Citrobacter sp. Cu233 TaxID=2985160 RepID=UPI0025759EF0|nr:EscV/YscV/HrcV family type III secretion system export apparatus protein [Citrobacter sp. Cu233]MDM2932067.1 EscV/YscV/HrcV family type III secretion system export apparatus protein [Citrobacter sp. Cu233]
MTMWQKIAQRPELFLVVLMISILAMLIIPLPTWLIDILLAFNITFSILIFIGTFYIQKVLEFSALPSLLLITTLFRLALSISTSRMILVQADAGHIITTFGNFVIAGDIIVGFIIFSIVTLFQFIVITKGSERVAEVCARFSLDAMPGKQMSIDADLRAGNIDADQAQMRRSMLEKESQLYGALDGTMKFIKGDAIASIVIIFVNFIGGVSIGMGRHGLSFSAATDIYTILTIGDALVAQIPALLISVGTGFVVTRVSEDGKNLGNNIIDQIFQRDFVLIVTAVVAVLIGCLPGFPLFVFVLIASIILAVFFNRLIKAKRQAAITAGGGGKSGSAGGSSRNEKDSTLSALSDLLPETVPLMVMLPEQGFSELDLEHFGMRFSREFYINYGVELSRVNVVMSPNVAKDRAVVLINEVSAGEFPICFGHYKVLNLEGVIELPGVEVITVENGDDKEYWVTEPSRELCLSLGFNLRGAEDEMMLSFQSIVTAQIAELFGIQETKNIMDKLERQYPELLKETYRHCTVQRVSEVLQRLLSERISVRNMKAVLEALALWGGKERDTIQLVEHVRGALARYISDKFSTDNILLVMVLSPELEGKIRKGIKTAASGSFINMDPADNEFVMNRFELHLSSLSRKDVVLLTAVDIRRYTKRLMMSQFSDLDVISFGEISESVKVNVIKMVD